VHEKNRELLQAGVLNAWTEKSLEKLAELMPGRYAKDEMSGGFLGAIDRYVYRSPVSQVADTTSGGADTPPRHEPVQTTRLTPMAVDDGVERASTQ
jgi:hypothetical protein